MLRRYLKFILFFISLQVFISFIAIFMIKEAESWLLENDHKNFISHLKSVTIMHDEMAEKTFHLLDTSEITKLLS